MADGSVLIDTKLDTNGFEKGLKSLGGIASRGFSVIATGITAVSGALAAAGGAAIKLGSDFEAGMSEVAAISGASAEQLDELTQKALEMGAKTKFSASDSADAFKYMAMAGWKTEDMLVGVEGIMNLAAAAGTDLGTASDIVTDALTAMGYTAADAGQLANVMAAASSNANTNVEMMGETFKYAAPLIGALGYNMEDAATAIGLMANAGIKGGQAGTSLRSILTRLANPTKESATAMERYGISLTDAKGNMLPLSNLMDQFRSKLGHLSEEEQASAAAALGGQEAMSGLLAIINAAPEDYAKLTEAVATSNEGMGAAAEMSAKMQDNLKGDFVLLSSAADTLGIAIYDYVVDPLRAATQAGTKLVESLNAALADGGLEGLVTAAGDAIAQVVGYIANFVPQVADLAVQLIHSFIAGIQTNAQTIALSATAVIVKFTEGILTILPELVQTGITLITELGKGISNAIPFLLPMAAECINSIVQAFIGSAPQIIQAGGRLISSFASGIVGSLGTMANIADQVINALYSGLTNGISRLGDAAKQLMTSLGGYLEKQLPVMIDSGLKMVVGLTGAIRDSAGKIVDGAIALAKSLAKGLADSLPTIIQNVPTIVSNIANTINDNAPKILSAGVEIIGTLIKGIIKAIPTLIANIPQIIKAIVNTLQAFNWLNIGSSIVSGIGNGIKGAAGIAKSAIQNVMNVMKSGASGMVSGFANIGKAIVEGIWNGITNSISWLGRKISSFGDTVLSIFSKVFKINSPSKLMRDTIGIGIGEGIAAGIDKSDGIVSKSVQSIANDVSSPTLAGRMRAVVAQEVTTTGGSISGISDGQTNQSGIDYDQMGKSIWKHAPDMNTYLDGEELADKMEPRISEKQARKAAAEKKRGG